METRQFDPVRTELRKGVNLIEASAGTGKTYAIAMLLLRFVVEQGISIDKILVVTFTKAATEELKHRVRSRLAEVKMVINGCPDKADLQVIDWLNKLRIEPELIKQRLDLALLNLDQAGIFTIHGFCQRILREHALESGQLFDAELTDDLALIKQACADDFWRRQLYKRTEWEVAVLTANYKTPDQLLASVDFVASHVSIFPDVENLDSALQELQRLVNLAKAELEYSAKYLLERFSEQKFKISYTGAFERHCHALKDWLEGHTTQIPDNEAFLLLTGNGLKEALNGIKFKANKIHTSEQRKADYLAELKVNTAPFDALAKAFENMTLFFRRALLETLRMELDKRLQQLNVMSFDNLITQLADALQGENGNRLIIELRQRFEVALIDEFQDTDDSQWFIFSSVFAASSQYLYLIGDPKQAIYKFRGADIYSYLDAQKSAESKFTLEKNWRSHPHLVDAVNALFQRERALLLEDLVFHNLQPAKKPGDGELHYEGQAIPPMMLWQLPESDSKTGCWRPDRKEAATAICIAVVNEVIDLLTAEYTLQPDNRNLQPKDIAILVRTNSQAREYQSALRSAGVPSVINSTESVFASLEAADLYVLLQAIANPGDLGLLKQALTLSWFDLDGQAFYRLINNETAMDGWMNRFLRYFQDWQHTGLLAMMQGLLVQEKIRERLSRVLLAERRLTNLYHLIELVQQAAVDAHLGINKTLDWLKTAINKAARDKNSSENQQLRLESDDDAVRIVTMHRSKGLEYSVVFCPCLWESNNRLNNECSLIKCHIPGQGGESGGRMIVDLGSEDFELHRAQALKEALAEDLRVFYVAVTRAKYRCYLAWADARFENTAKNSAVAWLLDFADADFGRQQALLQAFKDQAPQAFDYQLLAVPGEIKGDYQKTVTQSEFHAKKRKRSLHTHWQMSSYTALSALSLDEAPELPEDKAMERLEMFEQMPMDLPRGSHTGNVVHDLLENNVFVDLAKGNDISVTRDKACQRYGLKLEHPQILDKLLQTVVSTPLSDSDADFCLMNLPESRCLKEMPFYLSIGVMDTYQLNLVLQDSPAFQPLTSKQMSGYLTGFIDLICEYKGLYYVMDYKTNSLPDYKPETLAFAMREHNYGLQYWIYTVVLHRYLQIRLQDYDFATHFGGVRYLFVRGMRHELAMSGVYQDRPDLEKVEALAALFGKKDDGQAFR